MSIRESPVSNRILDLKEKERAYKKHMQAIATAKTTLDTSTPEPPGRLKVKERNDARFRRHLKSDYSKREKMIDEVRQGTPSSPNDEDKFPDDYYPDEDDVDIDKLISKYNDNDQNELNSSDDDQNEQKIKGGKKGKKETIKIGFANEPVFKIEEEEEEENDNASRTGSNKKSRIPISNKRSPSSASKMSEQSPSQNELGIKPSRNFGFSPKTKAKTNDGPDTPSKNSEPPNKLSNSNKLDSSRRSTRPSTANSTATFNDDFECDDDADYEDENDNFDDFAPKSDENDENEKNEKNQSGKSFTTSSTTTSLSENEEKALQLAEISGSNTQPMSGGNDEMPELDFNDF